jgi:ankyrin repeat protein
VEILLQHRANINIKNNNKHTPLYEASIHKHAAVIKTLLINGADITISYNNGNNILHILSDKGNIPILLNNRRIDVNVKNDIGNTPLHILSYEGDIDFMLLLLNDKDIDINAKNNDGNTALHYASEKGNRRKVNLLLKKGADVNLKNNKEWTALHYASQYGYIDIVEILINVDANVKAENIYGETAYNLAKNDEIKQLLKNKISTITIMHGDEIMYSSNGITFKM